VAVEAVNPPVRLSIEDAKYLLNTVVLALKIGPYTGASALAMHELRGQQENLERAISAAEQEERQREALRVSMSQNSSCASKDLG
jgi:hypothetical protein